MDISKLTKFFNRQNYYSFFYVLLKHFNRIIHKRITFPRFPSFDKFYFYFNINTDINLMQKLLNLVTELYD